MLRSLSRENFCIRAMRLSIISTTAGISTRVSVQTVATSFFRCSVGMDLTVSKISAATNVLSLPPLKPTSHGRGSFK